MRTTFSLAVVLMPSPVGQERKRSAETITRTIRYLFGALMIAALAVVALGTANAASNFTTLYRFTGASTGDGAGSLAGLISDTSGTFYGMTPGGGEGIGTVFKLIPPAAPSGIWTESVLHRFAWSDGATPQQNTLIMDASGALYGMTYGGGISCPIYSEYSCGIVFKLTPPSTASGAWTESVLYSFKGGSDGANPHGGLIMDASGVLYGTTEAGGVSCPIYSIDGCGTVFKLTPPSTASGTWAESVLYDFKGVTEDDGSFPLAGLIADASGALYGTTAGGGPAGCGTVFKMTPPTIASDAWTESTLYSFTCGTDGGGPFSDLIRDASGALYGTTESYGTNCLPDENASCGTVFKLTPPSTASGAWTESVLYSFKGGSDGANPWDGVIMDASSALYGTTGLGGDTSCNGPYGCGTVFKLTPPVAPGSAWIESVLHSFTGGSDEAYPIAGLLTDGSGAFYGTTDGSSENCSNIGCGTVFKLQTFAGTPGQANCIDQSVSALAKQYGGLAHAAAALDYSSVGDLQDAVATYCNG